MSYQYILFDLDGTLCDPGPGITDSVKFALNKLGIKAKDDLKKFVGPPLHDSFKKYYGLSEEVTAKAVSLYRERFLSTGIFEYKTYHGIEEILKELKTADKKLAVATSKITSFANKILEAKNLLKYFDFVEASHPNEVVTKAITIQRTLKKFDNPSLSKVIMVGDREHDVIGARENKIDSVGVLFGYGTREELEEHHATHIATDVSELRRLLLN